MLFHVPVVHSSFITCILLYIHITIYLLYIDGHLDCCQILSTRDKAGINILEHLSVDIGTHLSWLCT